jgi:hypothetical protein
MLEEIGLDEGLPEEAGPRAPDPRQPAVEATLSAFFEKHGESVFFSKQIEVIHENDFYHWLTNRALRALVDKGVLRTEPRELRTGTVINLLWHRGNRYYKRAAAALVALVDEYSDPNVGGASGLHGEAMVLEGFARHQFVMRARDVNDYGGRKWPETEHNLDFVFERDRLAYGIEVKNTIKYMDEKELEVKIRMSQFLGLTPVFVCRMLPRPWILDLVDVGGFALILRWQLYPWTHLQLARRVNKQLGMPVDSPKRLADGTMQRFVRWHERRL